MEGLMEHKMTWSILHTILFLNITAKYEKMFMKYYLGRH